MTKTQRQEFASWLGKRSYRARVKRFGIERIREIARGNGAWRSLIEETAKRAGNQAARAAAVNPEDARRKAVAAFITDAGRLRFHDMRHQAITELAENGAADATIQALAGHMSPEMVKHYSHVRMQAKREVLDQLSCGLMKPMAEAPRTLSEGVN